MKRPILLAAFAYMALSGLASATFCQTAGVGDAPAGVAQTVAPRCVSFRDSIAGLYQNFHSGHFLQIEKPDARRPVYRVAELVPGTRAYRAPFGNGEFAEMARAGMKRSPDNTRVWLEAPGQDGSTFRLTLTWDGASEDAAVELAEQMPQGEIATAYRRIDTETDPYNYTPPFHGTFLLEDGTEALVWRTERDTIRHILWYHPDTPYARRRRGPATGLYANVDTMVWDAGRQSFRVRYQDVPWGLRGWYVPPTNGAPAQVVVQRENDGVKFVFVYADTCAQWPQNPFLASRPPLPGAQPANPNPVFPENPNPNQNPHLRKPVVYLYPTAPTDVMLQLDINNLEEALFYPALDARHRWHVTAQPNGTLTQTGTGTQFPSLFWEAPLPITLDSAETHTGWLIERAQLIPFLETQLRAMNFAPHEQAEFIQYWLPQMAQHPLVFVHFAFAGTAPPNAAGQRYAALAPLNITPTPDNLLRVLMLWHPVPAGTVFKNIRPQVLPRLNRTGFHVLEWGGVEVGS